MRRFAVSAISACILFSASGAAMDSKIVEAYDSIDPCAVYGYCRTISSAPYAGRLTGHRGYTEAARWAASKFAEWGLEGAFDNGEYLQPYPSPYVVVRDASMILYPAGPDGRCAMPGGAAGDEAKGDPSDPAAPETGADTSGSLRLELGIDFIPQMYTDSQERTSGLVFAGWGISAPDLGYDDYASIDARGKYVICFRGTPDEGNEAFEEHDIHRRRMETAKRMGAIGLFYIYPEPIANPNGTFIEGFAPAIISEKAADMILEERKITSKELREKLEASGSPCSFPLGSVVSYRVEAENHLEGVGYNVACVARGRSAGHSGECVVVGAHFDHCGQHMGMHFPGANDNASGSSCVMEIARAFSLLVERPRRTVVFVLFGGEEKGLEGSNWFADNLPGHFIKIDAMFNFDMTGEGDGAHVGYTGGPECLARIIQEADREVGTVRSSREIKHVGVRSSDFAPFFLSGAPCAAFSSNGPHLDYHETGDTIYRINPDILADIARLGFLSTFMRADR